MNHKKIEKIYNEYKDPIHSYVCRMCNDKDLAWDIVQYTFEKVLTYPHLEEVEHLKSFLYTIARNKLIDELKRKPSVSIEDQEMPEISGQNSAVSLQDAAEDAATKDTVAKTIRHMPEKYRELMLLRYTQDLTVAEVAEITNRSLSDIKVSLHRARLKFEEQLTASMYSKVAVSRDRCETLSDMLRPYADGDLPEQQLDIVYKHIAKCRICADDAEKMKRSRELFAALPMLPFPMAFDEFAKHLPIAPDISPEAGAQQVPASGATANSGADSANVTTANPAGAAREAVSQGGSLAINAKVVAAVAAAAVIGGLGLFGFLSGTSTQSGDTAANSQTQNTVAKETQNEPPSNSSPQNSSPQNSPPQKKADAQDTGTISLAAKLSADSSRPLADESIEWNAYPFEGYQQGQRDKATESVKGATAKFTLKTGKYVLTATLDRFVESETVIITADNEEEKSIVFDVGKLETKIAPGNDKNIVADKIDWQLYTNADPPERILHFAGNQSFYLLPGRYLLRASYTDTLVKDTSLEIAAGKTLTMERADFTYGQLNLAAKLSAAGPGFGDSGELNWTIDRLQNGKIEEKGITHSDTASPSFLLMPGDYRARVALGPLVEKSVTVKIEEGVLAQPKAINLAAGKLSLKLHMTNKNPSLRANPLWEVYQASDKTMKTPLLQDNKQREPSYYLPEGKYVVKTQYGVNLQLQEALTINAGNNSVTKNFAISPGAIRLSATAQGSGKPLDSDVHWTLEQQLENSYGFTLLKENVARKVDYVLAPGRYRITAQLGKNNNDNDKAIYEFAIEPGTVVDKVMALNDGTQQKRWEWK